ncbi:hypothetical protein NHX12_016553, partial [Muraenolepis orangiensis]
HLGPIPAQLAPGVTISSNILQGLRENAPQVSEGWYNRQLFTSSSEGRWCRWDVGTPLANYFRLDGVDGQSHPAVCSHRSSKNRLEVLWIVRYKSTVVCIL